MTKQFLQETNFQDEPQDDMPEQSHIKTFRKKHVFLDDMPEQKCLMKRGRVQVEWSLPRYAEGWVTNIPRIAKAFVEKRLQKSIFVNISLTFQLFM